MKSLLKLPIVDILNTGLAGFCFLVALFCFFLLLREQKKDTPRDNMLKSIESFTRKSLLFGVLVGLVVLGTAMIDRVVASNDRASVDEFIRSLPSAVVSNEPALVKQKIKERMDKISLLENQVEKLKKELDKFYECEKKLLKCEKQTATFEDLIKKNGLLESENVSLRTKNQTLEKEIQKMDSNFLIKAAKLNSMITEFGGASINPFYPFDERKRNVNMKIQDLLAELNHYSGQIDGDRYRTRDALVSYQHSRGFSETGYFALPTVKVMIEDYLGKTG
jgi:hypothetical protein